MTNALVNNSNNSLFSLPKSGQYQAVQVIHTSSINSLRQSLNQSRSMFNPIKIKQRFLRHFSRKTVNSEFLTHQMWDLGALKGCLALHHLMIRMVIILGR